MRLLPATRPRLFVLTRACDEHGNAASCGLLRAAAIPLGVTLVALGSGVGFAALRNDGILGPLQAVVCWKLVWLLLCAGAIMTQHRVGTSGLARELGLAPSLLPGFSLGALCSLPMLVVLATETRLSARTGGGVLVYTALATPLAEEVLFRGYLLRQLWRHAGLPVWLALAASAALFGVAHSTPDPGWWPNAAHFLTVGITGILLGAVFVASGANLWLPIGVHAGMNLWGALVEASTPSPLA